MIKLESLAWMDVETLRKHITMLNFANYVHLSYIDDINQLLLDNKGKVIAGNKIYKRFYDKFKTITGVNVIKDGFKIHNGRGLINYKSDYTLSTIKPHLELYSFYIRIIYRVVIETDGYSTLSVVIPLCTLDEGKISKHYSKSEFEHKYIPVSKAVEYQARLNNARSLEEATNLEVNCIANDLGIRGLSFNERGRVTPTFSNSIWL